MLSPRRDPDVDYFGSLLDSVLSLQSITLHARNHSFVHFAALLPFHVNSCLSLPATNGSEFSRLRKELKVSVDRLLRKTRAADISVVRDALGERHDNGVRRRQKHFLQSDNRHDTHKSRGLRAVIPRFEKARLD